MGGFDLPTAHQDDLVRLPFAKKMYRLLIDVPPAWSVRLGIHGRWGEGKTSILAQVKQLALADDHIVVEFTPWSAKNSDEMLRQFIVELLDTIESKNIKIVGYRKKIYESIVRSEKWSNAIQGVAASGGIIGSGLTGIFSIARSMMDPHGELLKNVFSTIPPNKRIIVMIDDLDRAPRTILPDLMLSLRTIFDTAGFSYVLAFDSEIVARALKEEKSELESGHEFLEKLLDFSFEVPKITPEQKKKYVESMVREGGFDWIDQERLTAIVGLFPSNPRKIKRFMRHLNAIRQEINRHYHLEIEWGAVYLSILIRLESEKLLEQLVLQEVGWENILDESEPREKYVAKTVGELLRSCGIEQGHRWDYLEKLCRSFLEIVPYYSEAAVYSANLLYKSNDITRKEFEDAFSGWKKSSHLSIFSALRVSEENFSMLFARALEYRRNWLNRASNARDISTHKAAMQNVSACLIFIRELYIRGIPADALAYRKAEFFREMFSQFLGWKHFDKNESDQLERQHEVELLKEIAHLPVVDPEGIIKCLSPWNPPRGLQEGGQEELAAAVLAPQLRSLAKKMLRNLAEPGYAAKIAYRDEMVSERYLISLPEGPFWGKNLTHALRSEEPKEYLRTSALELLYVLREGLNYRAQPLSPESVKALIGQRPDMVALLWETATSEEIQYRMLSGLREMRELLVNQGVSEQLLPIPRWLEPQ